MKHLDKHDIHTDSRFGFRTQHSCEMQLAIYYNNDIAKAMGGKSQADVAMLDFSKLSIKLLIQGCYMNWINMELEESCTVG